MPDTPLNPDALEAAAEAIATRNGFGCAQFSHKGDAHAAVRAYLSSLPVAPLELTNAEWQAFQAIPDQGYSHRAWVDARIAERVAVAQPVLDETALANLIAWKSLPFGATQFVKLDANAAHKVIELLKPHLAVAQPEVNSFDPRVLNSKGWTCGCEPGNYDSCDECRSACNELANFLNRPVVNDA